MRSSAADAVASHLRSQRRSIWMVQQLTADQKAMQRKTSDHVTETWRLQRNAEDQMLVRSKTVLRGEVDARDKTRAIFQRTFWDSSERRHDLLDLSRNVLHADPRPHLATSKKARARRNAGLVPALYELHPSDVSVAPEAGVPAYVVDPAVPALRTAQPRLFFHLFYSGLPAGAPQAIRMVAAALNNHTVQLAGGSAAAAAEAPASGSHSRTVVCSVDNVTPLALTALNGLQNAAERVDGKRSHGAAHLRLFGITTIDPAAAAEDGAAAGKVRVSVLLRGVQEPTAAAAAVAAAERRRKKRKRRRNGGAAEEEEEEEEGVKVTLESLLGADGPPRDLLFPNYINWDQVGVGPAAGVFSDECARRAGGALLSLAPTTASQIVLHRMAKVNHTLLLAVEEDIARTEGGARTQDGRVYFSARFYSSIPRRYSFVRGIVDRIHHVSASMTAPTTPAATERLARDAFLHMAPEVRSRLTNAAAAAVWNHLAQARIAKNPTSAVVGDLYLHDETEADVREEANTRRRRDKKVPTRTLSSLLDGEEEEVEAAEEPADDSVALRAPRRGVVRVVATPEEAASVPLARVVLPTLGGGTQLGDFPESVGGAVGAAKAMEACNIDPLDFARARNEAVLPPGVLRPLLAVAEDVEVVVRRNVGLTQNLQRYDGTLLEVPEAVYRREVMPAAAEAPLFYEEWRCDPCGLTLPPSAVRCHSCGEHRNLIVPADEPASLLRTSVDLTRTTSVHVTATLPASSSPVSFLSENFHLHAHLKRRDLPHVRGAVSTPFAHSPTYRRAVAVAAALRRTKPTKKTKKKTTTKDAQQEKKGEEAVEGEEGVGRRVKRRQRKAKRGGGTGKEGGTMPAFFHGRKMQEVRLVHGKSPMEKPEPFVASVVVTG